MSDRQFSPGDPNGDAIRAASGLASTLRSRRGRRPVVVIGIALLALGVVVVSVLAVLSR
ncbi:hypothetical protein [Cellulomonas sp. PhB150]|uniref:hypothetical protein n=1 Tax=Cellulomonas sp. PhB150 TaxID=2485188 RepID=UPI000FA3BB72|nr:hypothetical protein [Cellulomonas sp. PhB150]ROS30746.1 hypothetical protein EDF34_0385 [Cellulomonas sp. PhB150]